MKIIAMINRSAGNETVGDMWTETAAFDSAQTLNDVYQWAHKRVGDYIPIETMTTNIKLSICQNDELNKEE